LESPITEIVIIGEHGRELTPNQLKSARLAAGLTQREAANRLGVSQAYLALLELVSAQSRYRWTAKILVLGIHRLWRRDSRA
jgi:predicted DNA-binding protein (UPF0251 family)